MLSSLNIRSLVAFLGVALSAADPKLPERYETWLQEEVPYVITKDERRDFQKLKTDAERDRFIQEFWELRGSIKEEHYKRIEYANRHFGRMSGTPGWRTDMGRTYILFGPPQSRAPYIGYGQIYPLELWFYANRTGNPSLPPFFHVLFYMPDDIGEFRFYRPIVDGPMKLVRGTQFRGNADVYRFLKPLNPDLARAAFSLVPGEPLDTDQFRPSAASEMLVSKIQNFSDDPFNVERMRESRSLRERVKSWFLVAQQRPIELSHFVYTDPAGQLWLDYAFLVDSAEFGKSANGQFVLHSGFRLLTPDGALIVEDAEERAYPGSATEPFLVANRVPLAPGSYKLEVQITNREASRSWRAERAIEAERGARVSVTGPLLARSAVRAQPETGAPFQYYGAQFTPAPARTFSQRDSLIALFRIDTPGDYRVEYVLASPQNRASRQIVSDEVKAAGFREGALLKSKTLPLAELEPGDYRLIVNVRTPESAQVLASATAPFKMGEPTAVPALYFTAGSKAVYAPGVAAYIRALQSLTGKQEDQAARYLGQSLAENPANPSALQTLVRLHFRSGKYAEITALYKRAGETPFKTSSETLAQTALSFWRTGEGEQARNILKAADSYFPKDPNLQAAAKAIR